MRPLKINSSFVFLTCLKAKTMTYIDDTAKLDDYDSEHISDILVKLEKSFSLKFEKDAFYNVKTFGDLCDVFESHMNHLHRDD
jgi:acyl carrier protein